LSFRRRSLSQFCQVLNGLCVRWESIIPEDALQRVHQLDTLLCTHDSLLTIHQILQTTFEQRDSLLTMENTLLQEILRKQAQTLKRQKRKQRTERIVAGAAILLVVVLSL